MLHKREILFLLFAGTVTAIGIYLTVKRKEQEKQIEDEVSYVTNSDLEPDDDMDYFDEIAQNSSPTFWKNMLRRLNAEWNKSEPDLDMRETLDFLTECSEISGDTLSEKFGISTTKAEKILLMLEKFQFVKPPLYKFSKRDVSLTKTAWDNMKKCESEWNGDIT